MLKRRDTIAVKLTISVTLGISVKRSVTAFKCCIFNEFENECITLVNISDGFHINHLTTYLHSKQ